MVRPITGVAVSRIGVIVFVAWMAAGRPGGYPATAEETCHETLSKCYRKSVGEILIGMSFFKRLTNGECVRRLLASVVPVWIDRCRAERWWRVEGGSRMELLDLGKGRGVASRTHAAGNV
ncbi:hypothetical protein EYF80_049324 [Liparis tanakae]|uniref:Uncharacterized protein n=1 Tax=Liparis tanakae TaxID=230148 RepID=A0A4Z2FIB1_9TELE|nr:hypothetical protein EYF80_049324 [Liparis tanakae]